MISTRNARKLIAISREAEAIATVQHELLVSADYCTDPVQSAALRAEAHAHERTLIRLDDRARAILR